MKHLSNATLLACSALVLAACGGGGTADVLNISNPTMRIVNAMPSDPTLQLYRNSDAQTIAGTPTYEESSKYFDTVSTTSEWSVRDASTGLQIGATSVSAAGSTRYTLIAFPGTGTAADLMQISDPYDVSLTSDSARVRVVNASLNSGPFDVYITAPGVDIVANAATLTNVAYETAVPATGNNSYSFPSGTYEIRLTLAGTKTVFFDGTLTAGNNDDLLLVSLPNSDAAGDVKLLDIPSATDELNSEIFSN